MLSRTIVLRQSAPAKEASVPAETPIPKSLQPDLPSHRADPNTGMHMNLSIYAHEQSVLNKFRYAP